MIFTTLNIVPFTKKMETKQWCIYCSMKNTHNISQITEEDYGNLFISDLVSAKCLTCIMSFDIKAVVNVSSIPYKSVADNYLEHHILDDPSEDLSKGFNKIYKFIDKHLSSGVNVLIHCHAGISRSVSFAAYYLMRSKQISFTDALDKIRAKRPIAAPNHGFCKQLIGLDFAFDELMDN